MDPVPPRVATVVLVGADGRPIGRLPPLTVATPWWHEAWPIVDAVREAYGVEVVVVRMLDSELPRPHGGGVTYLAELHGEVSRGLWSALEPTDWVSDMQPRRAPWAEVGGAAADLAWAEASLAADGLRRDGPARQVRSWNLSSIWELPLAGGDRAWLKAVPPFFAHEGAMLRALAGGPVPRLLAADGNRVLLADIPGRDRYTATLAELEAMVSLLVGLQVAWAGRVGELLAIGVPDWRGPALEAAIREVVERNDDAMSVDDRRRLGRLLDALPDRFEALAACGLPDTLVHGDFHQGNTRGVPDRPETLVLLDWGDSGVGQPLLDQPAFLDMAPDEFADPLRAHWARAWTAAVPGSDPETAARLIAPLAAARQAVIYQRFLDGIEPVERRHHEADLVDWLVRTAALAP
jgi:Ser/Thr protein kinase RdoA (MazF antagonist)